MKKVLFLMLGILLTLPILAQEERDDSKKMETLISGDIESGGYGGAFVKVGPINNEIGVFAGGLGGWIINHRFVIGGKGYGLANNIKLDGLDNIRLDFGCGGGYIEYIIASNKLINASIHNMIGAGGLNYAVKNLNEPHTPILDKSDSFFVYEPGINLNLNVSSMFRIGLGASYRIVSGVDYDTLSDSNLSDLSAELIFKVGVF